MKRLVFFYKIAILVPVSLSLLCSFVLIVYQAVTTIKSIFILISQPDLSQMAVKVFAVDAIGGIDVFLVSVALYVI